MLMEINRLRAYFIWSILSLYGLARIFQLYADRLPTLFIVALHVVPCAMFALTHGAVAYGRKGILVFAGCCVGFGTIAEIASLHSGFPFGHYYFTEVMGPKVFQVPVLLGLAYLGIGYVSWILAVLILGHLGKPLRGYFIFVLPLLASFIMLAWDLSMEPDWSTVDRAWIWLDGGPYFGVPIRNFAGWFLTGYCYYQIFAMYLRINDISIASAPSRFWYPAILLYAICALGNLLIFKLPMAATIVTDASGVQWVTADILRNCAFISVVVMIPFALLACGRMLGAREK